MNADNIGVHLCPSVANVFVFYLRSSAFIGGPFLHHTWNESRSTNRPAARAFAVPVTRIVTSCLPAAIQHTFWRACHSTSGEYKSIVPASTPSTDTAAIPRFGALVN